MLPDEMTVFVRVVQAGSFSAAARQLDLPKSTVSRKIADLEGRLRARLLQRTTRKLGLTDAGRIYFERAARIVAEIEDAERAVGRLQSEPRGLLRATAPLSFDVVLGPIVAAFLARHVDVQVEMVCTDRAVDLVEERFDVAIRVGELSDSSLVARTLGQMKRVVVADPGYCKAHGTPKAPADLAKHAVVAFGAGASPDVWVLVGGGKRAEVRVTPRLTVNDLEIARASALAGVGIACLPEFIVREDLRRGKLRRVLPDWSSAEAPLHAVYPTARHLSPKVAAFLALVSERLSL